MPALTTDETVSGFAWCNALDGKCPGYLQEPVTLRRQVFMRTYKEGGAEDMPLDGQIPESEFEFVTFEDAGDRVCQHCGSDREATTQTRIVYARETPAAREAVRSGGAETASLRAEVEELKALVAAQAGLPVKRGPGRPPKQQDVAA